MTNQTSQALISIIGIDIGKNSFHVIGFDELGHCSVPEAVAWPDRGTICQSSEVSRWYGSVRRIASSEPSLTGTWS